MTSRVVLAAAAFLLGCASPQTPVQRDAAASPTDSPLDHLKHDPQENDPRLRAAFKQADAEADHQLAGEPPRLGQIHSWWKIKKDFLLRTYGIRWRTPAELNPNVAFD